jgi:hypothetical protein
MSGYTAWATPSLPAHRLGSNPERQCSDFRETKLSCVYSTVYALLTRIHRYHPAFCLKLIKVNHDGPSLQVRAVFSLVESSTAEYCKVDGINHPEDQGNVQFSSPLLLLIPI